MSNHSSILAWGIPWIEEPGSLYCPWGLKELDMTERLKTHTHTHPCVIKPIFPPPVKLFLLQGCFSQERRRKNSSPTVMWPNRETVFSGCYGGNACLYSISVCLAKAMVFPVVTYGCESWTVKKAERRRINASKN